MPRVSSTYRFLPPWPTSRGKRSRCQWDPPIFATFAPVPMHMWRAWLILTLLPSFAHAQREEVPNASQELPTFLRRLGYQIVETDPGISWTVRIGANKASLIDMGSFFQRKNERRILPLVTESYQANRYVPREQVSAWRRRVGWDFAIRSSLDGTVSISRTLGEDPAEWDPGLQGFLKDKSRFEKEILSGYRWATGEHADGHSPKVDEATWIDRLSYSDINYLITQWGWAPKRMPDLPGLGLDAVPVVVRGQLFSLSSINPEDYGGGESSVQLIALHRFDRKPDLTWAKVSGGEVSKKIDISGGITLRELRKSIEDFANHLATLGSGYPSGFTLHR